MNKKHLYILISTLIFCIIIGIFIIQKRNSFLEINPSGIFSEEISIKYVGLEEEKIIYSRDTIASEKINIPPSLGTGESHLVLSIDGKSQDLVGYVDTNNHNMKIVLTITHESSGDIIVDYNVKTAMEFLEGQLIFPK